MHHPLNDLRNKRQGFAQCVYLNAAFGQVGFAATTRASTRYDRIQYQPGDVFVFGRETSGLPEDVRESFPPGQRIKLPMRPDNRSLNLSNSVAIVVYEAWRQHDFAGAAFQA